MDWPLPAACDSAGEEGSVGLAVQAGAYRGTCGMAAALRAWGSWIARFQLRELGQAAG